MIFENYVILLLILFPDCPHAALECSLLNYNVPNYDNYIYIVKILNFIKVWINKYPRGSNANNMIIPWLLTRYVRFSSS
jgi:hypothetical protein